MVELSIIIPSYNRNYLLNECIDSIVHSKLSNIEVIIVNDYKKKDIELTASNKVPYIRIFNNPKEGVASARNFGAKNAKSDKILFVDDDMILNRNAIKKAIDFLEAYPNATCNANWIYEEKLTNEISKTSFGRYLIKNNFTTLKGWVGNETEWRENSMILVGGITSQFLAITKSNFEKIGGYNEEFPFAGFEDYDLNKQLVKANILSYIDTTVLIYHNEIDRVNPVNWLARKKRGAITRRVAVDLGFSELGLHFGFFKKMLLQLLSLTKPLLMFVVRIFPNSKALDHAYAKLINMLIAINIFEGFTNSNKK